MLVFVECREHGGGRAEVEGLEMKEVEILAWSCELLGK
jgi:hypothetical protein